MSTAPLESIVAELVPLVRGFARGEYGIALGGAHAKGNADEASDLDLYLFAREVRPRAEREAMVRAFSPEVGELVCWGADEPFSQGGTDFRFRGLPVECWLRHPDGIERALAQAQAGTVTREFVTWTTTGFYDHCALSDVKAMAVLEDPSGMLAGWKSQVAVYPLKLREAIIAQHLPSAHFWPGNFHYESAVARGDVIYVTGIVQQVVHNLIQVLFALNETYFPGDKKLDIALAHLDRVPAGVRRTIAQLLWPDHPPTPEALRHQQAALQGLVREVDELAAAR